MRMVVLLVLAGGACGGDDALGIWKMNPRRSAFTAERAPRNFTLRIERHAQGEVFTVERTEQDGRSSSDSTILFFDRKPREYQDQDCRGTQSSQRLDNRTVEILRTCEAGAWTRVIRRVNTNGAPIVEVSGRRADGRPIETRLVLEKE